MGTKTVTDHRPRWTKLAANLLQGKRILKVRYMTDEEREAHDWMSTAVVLELEGGLAIYPSRDDEGNDAGALFTTDDKLSVLPVI